MIARETCLKLSKGLGAALTCAAALAVCGSAFAQEKVRLGLDWSYLPYHAPLVLAQERGYYADEGIEVVMEPGRGSGTTAIMLGEANYDIAHINTTNAAAAIAQGVPIEVVAVYQLKTASAFIGIDDRVDLDGIESVKKYKIASTPGGSDQLGLKIFASVNKIPQNELNIVAMDGSAKQAALLSGRVDLISGDGFAYAAVVRGQGMPPEVLSLADYGVPLLGFGYSANKEYAAAHPETVTAFLRATRRGWQDAVADPTTACERAIEKLNLTHDQDQCVDYFTGLIKLSTDPNAADWGKQSEERWTQLISVLKDVGEIQGDFEVSSFFTNQYLPK